MPTEPSKQELAAAKEWLESIETGVYALAKIIHKHMNPLPINCAMNELYELYSKQVPGAPAEKLWDKTIDIIERTGRTVSDANTKE